MDHLQQIVIDPARLARWQEAARALGVAGHALTLELADVTRDPSRHMLMRAARAARFAELATSGNDERMANAVATELEIAAEGDSL